MAHRVGRKTKIPLGRIFFRPAPTPPINCNDGMWYFIPWRLRHQIGYGHLPFVEGLFAAMNGWSGWALWRPGNLGLTNSGKEAV